MRARTLDRILRQQSKGQMKVSCGGAYLSMPAEPAAVGPLPQSNMPTEAFFRLSFVAVLAGLFLISGYFRRRARREEAIARVREGRLHLAARLLVALSLIAANWFMLAMALIAFLGLAGLVVPKVEAMLIQKFGQAYRDYQQRTFRFAPRLRIRS
jgi:protein-S-isoprenylcysteine O-methyltransferase Ste14